MFHAAHGKRNLFEILNGQRVAVAQNAGVKVAEKFLLGILFGVGVKGLLPADVPRPRDVWNGEQFFLEGPRLTFGPILVDERHDFIGTGQRGEVHTRVDGHQRERTHDEQTAHRHAHGGETHQTVTAHIFEGFPEEVKEMMFTHSGGPPRNAPRRHE